MNKKQNKIEITLIKSSIGYNYKQKRTLEALGLRKINSKTIKNSNNAIYGMIKKVIHLVDVKEISWRIN